MLRKLRLFVLGLSLVILISCSSQNTTLKITKPNVIFPQANLSEQINYTLNLAKYKLAKTVDYLENQNKKEPLYPTYTGNTSLNKVAKPKILRNNPETGIYTLGKSNFWASGNFTGLLWKIYELETDEKLKKIWLKKAIWWSKPLVQRTKDNAEDMTINSLFAFKPWYENSSGFEKNRQLKVILEGAGLLAQPLNVETQKGRFSEKVGIMGFFRKADRTDNRIHWHGFVDHTVNVEQLLWASKYNPNSAEAENWRNVATSHIKTLAKNMGENRQPGESGTWQRGYFDLNPRSLLTYGQFLFNEGKQGWKDDSTWSRGQAWWIYGASITYEYTKDPEILAIAKNAVNYYFAHLPDKFPGEGRREGDFIPPWDFDYALEVNPDTEKDTSASAIAMAGILRLINSLPIDDLDRQRYWEDSTNTIKQLISPQYLAVDDEEMSILKHGCYHHYESIAPTNVYDNGLIWGDYFFIDALQTYQRLSQK